MTQTTAPRVTKMVITTYMYPWQAEGQLEDGRWFYMRFRHCLASLGVGETIDEAVGDSENHEIDYHRDNAADCPSDGYCSGLEGEEIAYLYQRLWNETHAAAG